MRLRGDRHEVLGTVYVRMDPVVDGFAGVLVELSREGGRYVLREVAAGSGNRLLEFSSKDERLVRSAFEKELGTLHP